MVVKMGNQSIWRCFLFVICYYRLCQYWTPVLKCCVTDIVGASTQSPTKWPLPSGDWYNQCQTRDGHDGSVWYLPVCGWGPSHSPQTTSVEGRVGDCELLHVVFVQTEGSVDCLCWAFMMWITFWQALTLGGLLILNVSHFSLPCMWAFVLAIMLGCVSMC